MIARILTSIPFAVTVSLALIAAAAGIVTGRHLPFGAGPAIQATALAVGSIYTVAAIRRHQRRRS